MGGVVTHQGWAPDRRGLTKPRNFWDLTRVKAFPRGGALAKNDGLECFAASSSLLGQRVRGATCREREVRSRLASPYTEQPATCTKFARSLPTKSVCAPLKGSSLEGSSRDALFSRDEEGVWTNRERSEKGAVVAHSKIRFLRSISNRVARARRASSDL